MPPSFKQDNHSAATLTSHRTRFAKRFLIIAVLLILPFTADVYASAAPVAACSASTFTGISIPANDPDAAAVTSINVTSATLVNSATLGEYCDVLGNIKTIYAAQVPLNPGDNESTIQINVLACCLA